MSIFQFSVWLYMILLETTEYPESLRPVWALPITGTTLKVASEDITLPSQLLRTHAPNRLPLNVSVYPCTLSLCRLSPVPAEKRFFPTLSLQSLRRCLDPYSVVFFGCIYSLLLRKHRPHARSDAFGTQNYPCNATSTGRLISKLQSFIYFQAPTLVRPPGRTHRSNLLGGQAVYTTHRQDGYPFPDVASLRVRHEQLTRLDFHQLDCSLVGCSRSRSLFSSRSNL